jgi:hypothetical protein
LLYHQPLGANTVTFDNEDRLSDCQL